MIPASSYDEKIEFLKDLGEIPVYTNPAYESALIGVDLHENRAVYDYDLMIKCLVESEGWTVEEAVEWVDYNVIGLRGEGLPIVIERFSDGEGA